MDLFIQFGYGMMDHCRSLLSAWGGGTVILSPRDLTESQLKKLAKEVHKSPNGHVLLDPQFYLPHADHERLTAHAFWPKSYSTGAFWQGPELHKLLAELNSINDAVGSESLILPGLLATRVTDDWLTVQEQTIEEANTRTAGRSLMATIALSADAMRTEADVAALIERSAEWDVPSYYIVAEHPQGRYFVDDPSWLANLLDLSGALRMRGAKVVLGYSNQQMLIAGCAKVNAIASGTWMNVRSFATDKFRAAYDEEIRQRSVWYYGGDTFSEYKVPFLDVAHRLGLLKLLAPSTPSPLQAISALFSGVQPSSTGLSEQAAFRHYLMTLRDQARSVVRPTFAETLAAYDADLDAAESLLSTLSGGGVRGQLREFSDAIDVARGALAVFRNTRGVMLARTWATIPN